VWRELPDHSNVVEEMITLGKDEKLDLISSLATSGLPQELA
jgi:hypothetical protein